MNTNENRGKSAWKIVTALLLAVLSITGMVWAVRLQNPPISPPVTVTAKIPEKTTTYHDVYLALRQLEELQSESGLVNGERALTDGVKESFAMAPAAEESSASMYSADAEVASSAKDAAYGKTNIQVEGVDEADIVKNDGRYLYILSENGNGLLSIVDIASMTLLSQTRFTHDPFREMYVMGDRLVLLGSQSIALKRSALESIDNYSSQTKVLIYDITDRENVRLAREFSQDGDYVSSRLVDGKLYVISSFYPYFTFDDFSEKTVTEIVPYTKDSVAGTDPKPLPGDCIAISETPGSTFTVVSGLDITTDAPASTKTVMGMSGCIVYSTPSRMYISNGWNTDTELMRYTLSDGQVTYDGKATIPGYVKDQFALDEYNGYLRVATTSYETETSDTGRNEKIDDLMTDDIAVDIAWGGETVNNLYILDEKMEVVGKVVGLAKGETIQSVRYAGDMAYVVTFRQTDPLFAIDVSDPRNPVVTGQLKIPGFSSYMHPIDENTMLGIGFDADVETGGTTGLKLSLFDVSDSMNPIETHKLIISGECYSAATSDHKAVTYIAETNLLAIPVEIYGDVSVDGKRFTSTDPAGAFVIEVDKTKGLSLKAALTDPKIRVNAQDGWFDYSYERTIQRTTYLGNAFLTISSQSVLRYNLDTFALEKQLDLYS